MASTSGSALWLAGALPFDRQSQIGSPSLTLFWAASCTPISSLSYGGSDPQILKDVETPSAPCYQLTIIPAFPASPRPSPSSKATSPTTTMAKRKPRLRSYSLEPGLTSIRQGPPRGRQ